MAGNIGTFLRSMMRNGDPKVISKMGEAIKDIPNSEFFTHAPRPAMDARGVRKNYRINPKKAMGDESNRSSYVFEDMGTDSMFAPADPVNGYADATSVNSLYDLMGGPDYVPSGDLELWSQLPPNARAYMADTLFLGAGSGVGKRMYPAMFDLLSGQKGMYNVSGELTPINEFRKSLSMSDAIKRNPDLAGFLLPNEQQLSDTYLSPLAYSHRNTTDKIGALQQAAFSKLHRPLDFDQKTYQAYLNGRQNLGHGEEEMYKRSSDFLDIPLDIPLGDLNHLMGQENFGKELSTDFGIGPASIRRMLLLGNLLEDTQHPQEGILRKGLGFKGGGLAQYHHRSQ